MSFDETIRLIGAVAQLLGVLVWPAALIFALVFFRRGLGDFIGNLGEFRLKAAGVEASAKRQEAAAALGAAAARASEEGRPGALADPREVADALPSLREQRLLQGSRIIWVDDIPDNNFFERQALEALGIEIDLSTSTDDALEKIRRRSYDLIISDMGRPSDARAGYTLLARLREAGNKTPVVIYSGSRAPEHVREAHQMGAIGATNLPQELISVVVEALASRRQR